MTITYFGAQELVLSQNGLTGAMPAQYSALKDLEVSVPNKNGMHQSINVRFPYNNACYAVAWLVLFQLAV